VDGQQSGADEQVRAWAAVLRVHAAVVPRLERELAAVGMPLSWYDVLLELNAAPDGRLRMSELGARAVLSRERVSRVVDELERADLVRRERNPDDGRSLLAVITDEGRARFRAAAPTYLAGIERHFGAHVGDDAAAVATALLRVVEAADRHIPAREPARSETGGGGRGRSPDRTACTQSPDPVPPK
jgi:DNA-binding MarR family transcriptional regulator